MTRVCYFSQSRRSVLLTGETGSGKSVNINTLLQVRPCECVRVCSLLTTQPVTPAQRGVPQEFIPLTLTFSARTSANQIQDRLDNSMEKRARATFGPVAGCTFVITVDDLNMPELERFGAQPPLELLRQVSVTPFAHRNMCAHTILILLSPPPHTCITVV